ncbi:hypothetical protein [Streptomyces sp. NPDC056682]|uniref:hypothetical protein n=1 Tax=Streptomyces sp. NPDC056682 TaxID=3345909 RepID=UPI003699DEDB
MPEKKTISWWIAIAAGVATVVTLFVTLQDRPKPFTFEDWATHANSICDQDAGAVSANVRSGNQDYQALVQDLQYGQPAQTDFAKFATDLGNAADGVRKTNGDLAAIPKPNSRQPDVRDALEELNRDQDSMARAADDLQNVDASDPSSIQSSMEQATIDEPDLSQVNQKLATMGVTHCFSV